MGTITTGKGIFSGIDTATLINQLIAAESGPKTLAQKRVIQLQGLQAAYLDLNSKLGAMRTAAQNLRTNSVFKTNKATSTDDDVLTATASTSAAQGSYAFVVDRLVSTQQYLSRGFASGSTGGVAAGTFTFESAQGRLDRDMSLSDLNAGAGIARGKIVVSDAAGHSATIDLSKAATVNDVLDALNSAGGSLNLKASVSGGKFTIKSGNSSNLTITSAFGYTTAASLGIEASGTSSTVSGSTVYSLGSTTALKSVNDGNGVALNTQTGSARYDFTITVGGTAVNINIGDVYGTSGTVTESAPATLGGVLTRINDQLAAALGNTNIQASVAADGVSLRLVDSQNRTIEVAENTVAGSKTAQQLGIVTSTPATGTLSGKRILASLNSTLASTLNGGAGVTGDGQITITGRDGVARSVTIDTTASVADIVTAINTAGGNNYKAALNSKGTGLIITDTTNGSNNLIVSGTTATSLGIATVTGGVAASSVTGSNIQHQYITEGTTLTSLRAGQGVGTGEFRITDSTGVTATVTVKESDKTLDDVIRNINSRGTRIKARINDKGDGVLLYEDTGGGTQKIKVEDTAGSVATNLNLKGEASGTGTSNYIDGSFERQVTFAATDTLEQVATKINNAAVGVVAAVISDGTGSTPFRLSLTAKSTGSAGRFILDTGSFSLGETQLDAGNDAKVFFGSSDPAQGVLLTSSRNTLDNVIQGVSIDLKSVSSDPVTLSVTRDTKAVEDGIDTFVKTFNDLISRIDAQTKYDQDSNTKGTLLGDSTTELLRQGLYNTIQGKAQGVTSQFSSLLDVGLKIGQKGQIELNKDRLRSALEQDPQGVADLFTARVLKATSSTTTVNGDPNIIVNNPNAEQEFSSLGVLAQMEEFANRYLNSVDGTLTKRTQTIKDQISFQNSRIDAFNAQLDSKRQILQQQFLAMEEAIGRLQTQSSSLAGLGG